MLIMLAETFVELSIMNNGGMHMATLKKKKKENENPRLTEPVGTMRRPSGGYDDKAHALTARELAEIKRKKKGAKKK